MTNHCRICGTEIADADVFKKEYQYCRAYCCGCCPTKDGYRGEPCHADYIKRKNGEPVGFIEAWNQ